MYNEMIDRFQHYFPGNNDGIRVFFAPGRVNLIGDHTDYNGGYALPAALALGTYMAIRPRLDGQFHLISENFPDDPVAFSKDHLDYLKDDPWGNYPKGLIRELMLSGAELNGAEVLYSGNIPNAAGLSSSASIGMVTGYGLLSLSNLDISIEQLARICQRVENNFIGISTGIMDQYAVGFGEKDHALFLNCLTMDSEQVPLHLKDVQLVITNTNKRRGLADSEYNERRQECEKGLEEIQKTNPGIQTLGELTLDDFQQLQDNISSETLKRRVRHIVTEDERVITAKELLIQGDLIGFGKLMNESHESLRDDYEVTGRELDALFEVQKQVEGCIGTRMTGAGFGGCTVSIVQRDAVSKFKEHVQLFYEKKTGLTPSFYVSETGDGVKELKKVVA